MKISLSTDNLIMTNQGWLSPYEINKNKNVKVLSLEDKWGFIDVKKIENIGMGFPFIGKGHGHPELYLVKKENVLLTTEYERIWNKETRRTVRSFKDPSYLSAGEIDGKFWASPINIKTDENKQPIDDDFSLFFIISHYLGMGNIEKDMTLTLQVREDTKERIEESFKNLKVFYKKEDFAKFGEYKVDNKTFVEFINRHFPKSKWGSKVPYWIFNTDIKSKEGFLDGFMSSIGSKDEKKQKLTSKDKSLILTMKLIAQELGYSVGIYVGKGSKDKKSWQLVAEESARSSVVIDSFRYGLIREVRENREKKMNVWEIEIEESNGILVDGIVVR